MPDPPNNLPAAKAVLAMLRLYDSTGFYPPETPPAQMRRAASTYTGVVYTGRSTRVRTAIRDLAAWIHKRDTLA